MTPDTKWRRLVRAVKYVLSLEPVAVQAVVRAVLVLVATVGLTVSDQDQERVLLAVAAFYALVEVVTTRLARKRSTPSVRVVEAATLDGDVIAGPANELETGTVVRQLGDLSRPD